ncbi:MAG TPA: hypothetical protein VK395_02840 [Gemmataceae bacterium]|nr:hypothetical protein [Gemmataceae bacterium]
MRHRLCAAVTLLSYLVATLGLPLPAFAKRDAGQPFPCQNHPCGCQSAEQCWQHCCCFTPEERWAWAREHEVEPPAYAEKPRGLAWNNVRLRDQAGVEATQPAKSCCSNHEERRPCCQKDSDHSTKPTSPEGKSSPWFAGIAARHCQGLATLWISVGAVLFMPPTNGLSAVWLTVSRVRPVNEIGWNVRLSPPAPPPRLVPV